MTILQKPSGLELKPREDIIANGILAALNAEVVVAVEGSGLAAIDLRGTFSATMELQGSVDGTNFISIPVMADGTNTYVATMTAANVFFANVAGFSLIRVRCTAFTSGSVVCIVNACLPALPPWNRFMVQPAHSVARTLSAANTAGTVTIPAGGAGLFAYLTSISLRRINASAAAIVAGAVLNYTTTQLDVLAWQVTNGIMAWSHLVDVDLVPTHPIKSATANTAATIVMPAAGAGVSTEGIVTYYYGR